MTAALADDTFKCNFVNENVSIWIQISPNFIPKGSIHNMSSLVQVLAWRRTGGKPLPEQMIIQFNDAYMRRPDSLS